MCFFVEREGDWEGGWVGKKSKEERRGWEVFLKRGREEEVGGSGGVFGSDCLGLLFLKGSFLVLFVVVCWFLGEVICFCG